MNKLIFILIVLFFINNCSLNENSKIWKDKENKVGTNKNLTKVLTKKKKIASEFNPELKLELPTIIKSKKIIDNQNNFGSQIYEGELNKFGSFRFSSLGEHNQLDFKPIFLKNGIIFFDKKGSIVRYDNNQKVI